LVAEFLLSIRLTYRKTGQVFAITLVYEPCIDEKSADFWQEFEKHLEGGE